MFRVLKGTSGIDKVLLLIDSLVLKSSRFQGGFFLGNMSARPTSSAPSLSGSSRGRNPSFSSLFSNSVDSNNNEPCCPQSTKPHRHETLPPFLAESSCHFQWNLNTDIEVGVLEEILQRLDKISDEPGPFKRPRLEAKLARGYLLFSKRGDLHESVSLIGEVEQFCRDPSQVRAEDSPAASTVLVELRDEHWQERRKGLQHVAGSALANILWRSRKSLVESQIPAIDDAAGSYPRFDTLGPIGKAAVSGCRAFALSLFGADRVFEAISQYEKAAKLCPDSYLHHLNLGIALYRYCRETNDINLLPRQLKAFQKAAELAAAGGWADPLPQAFVGETIRQQAKFHHSRMRNALGFDDNGLTQKGTVRELNEAAANAFKQSLDVMKEKGSQYESVKALELIGHAYGSMPEPARKETQALECLEKAMAMDPDNPRVCHRIGLLHERVKGDLQTAITFYRTAKLLQKTDNSAIFYDFIRAKSLADQDYNPLDDFSHLIWKNREETLVKAFCWRGLYFLKVKGDHRSCLEDWLHALKIDPAGKEMKFVPDGPSWCYDTKQILPTSNTNNQPQKRPKLQENRRDYVVELQNLVHDLSSRFDVDKIPPEGDQDGQQGSWAVELLVRKAWVESLVGSKPVASSLYQKAFEVLKRQNDALGQQEILFQWMWTDMDQGKIGDALERLHLIKYPTMLTKMMDPSSPSGAAQFLQNTDGNVSNILRSAAPDPILSHAGKTRNAATTLLTLSEKLCPNCLPMKKTIAAITLIAKEYCQHQVIDDQQEKSCKTLLGLAPKHNCEAETMLKTLCRLRVEMCRAMAIGQSLEDKTRAVKAVLEEAKKCRDRAFNTFIDEFYPYARGRHYYPIVFNNSPKLFEMPRCDDPYWEGDPFGDAEKARGILMRFKLNRLNHIQRKHEPVVDFLAENNPMMSRKLWFMDHIERMVNEDKHSREMFLTMEKVDMLFPIAHLSADFSETVMEFFIHYTREQSRTSGTDLNNLFHEEDMSSLL